MNDENECGYDPVQIETVNHENVKMKGLLPTKVVKPQGEAQIKCNTLKVLSPK